MEMELCLCKFHTTWNFRCSGQKGSSLPSASETLNSSLQSMCKESLRPLLSWNDPQEKEDFRFNRPTL